MKCSNCGNENVADAAYCQVCYEVFRKLPTATTAQAVVTSSPMARPAPMSGVPIPEPVAGKTGSGRTLLLLLVLAALGGGGYFLYNRRPMPSANAPAFVPPPKLIEDSVGILCIPSGLDETRKHPLVVTLAPNGDAPGMIKFWTPVAHRHQWLVLASKKCRNGIALEPVVSELVDEVKNITYSKPIDPDKIIASGYSGGGMTSHFLIHEYSSIFSGVIVNTGMIHEQLQNQVAGYPRNKLAVFLASPTDFRYSQMQQDRKFLESLGWKTTWIEFNGGHVVGPESVYEQGVQWLEQNFIASK